MLNMKFENINEVILSLILWISSNTEHPKPINPINLNFIEQKELQDLACGRPCEIIAYTPMNKNNEIFLINSLNPLQDVCAQGILLHEIIHVIQQENEFAAEYEDNTKKHLREMNALVSHNLFLSHHGKKILYSNGFAAKFKTGKNSKNNIYC